MNRNRITICDIPVDVLTMQQTIDLIDKAIQDKKSIHHVVINAVKVVNAQKDDKLKDSIINCDIINADGQGIIWASRILNKPLPERVAGIDLMENLVALAAQKKYRIFFLGAKEEILSKVIKVYSDKYGNDIIAGYSNGYFKIEKEDELARQIAESRADILFVAMSSPKKEIFLNTYKNLIQTPFIMGVGGSFDVVAGFVKRAPKWMQDYGLEWFYRTMQEPEKNVEKIFIWKHRFYILGIKRKVKTVLK